MMEWSPQQDAALLAVSAWLKDKSGPQVFRLFGWAGTGKSTLARHLAKETHHGGRMKDSSDLVSRRSFIKGLMAASALVVASPAILVPTEVIAEPIAETVPRVEPGDLWMRKLGAAWFFVGETTAAQVWTEEETEDFFVEAYRQPVRRLLLSRTVYGRFEVAGDSATDKFLHGLMGAPCQFMVRNGPVVVRAQSYLTNFVHSIEHRRGFILSQVDVTVTGPLEVVL